MILTLKQILNFLLLQSNKLVSVQVRKVYVGIEHSWPSLAAPNANFELVTP